MAVIEAEDDGKYGFNPFAEELIASPFNAYRRLRDEDPVHWNAPLHSWILTRHEDITTVLADTSFHSIDTASYIKKFADRVDRDYGPLIGFIDAVLFFKEGEPHQRGRRTIARVMNRLPMRLVENSARDIANSLVAPLAAGGSFDAIGDFAEPFPQLVMAYILGIPATQVSRLGELLAELTLVFDAQGLATLDRLNAEALKALNLLSDTIEQRKPGDGLDIIFEAVPGAGAQKLRNAAAAALFVYRVGAETTMGLIGFLLRALVDRPELRDMMAKRPENIDQLVSEVLRLESNVQRISRVATEFRQVGGKTIEKGNRLLLLLGAANRDPLAFPNPDEIEIGGRRATADVAFGAGSHFCQGATLARLEARIAVSAFLGLPKLERAGPEKRYQGRTIRRITELPLKVASSA